MDLDSIAKILTLIVIVALVTTLVGHQNTAGDITATGNAFVGSLKAAEGSAVIIPWIQDFNFPGQPAWTAEDVQQQGRLALPVTAQHPVVGPEVFDYRVIE